MSNQTIYRVACRHKPYAQIGNAMLRDQRMSIEARGALAMILTYPSDWTISLAWLCHQAGVGRDKARGMIREMEAAGYCIRKRRREKGGTLGGYEFIFTDEPGALAQPAPENPSVVITSDGKPVTGQPAPENPTHSKEINKEPKNVTNTPPTPSQARGRPRQVKSALPSDWQLPDAWHQWAREQCPQRSLWISSEAEKFRDHFVGTAGRKADWAAAWRNWWRRACEAPVPKGTMRAPAKPVPPDEELRAPVWSALDDDDVRVYRTDTPEFGRYIAELRDAGEPGEAERIQRRGWVKLRPSAATAGTVAARIVRRAKVA